MELLSPAGSMEQAEAAISVGCDALYGGLKQWSARNRAINFTKEQYNNIIELCKKKDVKFYLTLNTLLKEKELQEIIDLFGSGLIHLPDAVIATDLGLIIMLRELFPQINIHASTQFGACSVDDVKFLEGLGVERVILSRELTLNEIINIKKQTNIEIEIFVYGSQCVAFSGQCLWGGLINGSSGNRGRCIGMCRDIYISNGKIGQCLYPQDIDAIGLVSELYRCGIDSIKIEGRLRTPDEIANIVLAYRTAINNEKIYPPKYAGYLKNCLPVKNMFNLVNPRTSTQRIGFKNFVSTDLLLGTNESGQRYYIWGDQLNYKENFEYVKTIFNNELRNDCANISLKLIVEDETITKIDFINTDGERVIYSLDCNYSRKIKILSIYEYLNSKINGNIYEFTSAMPTDKEVNISLESVDIIIKQINHICLSADINKNTISEISLPKNNVVFETDKAYVINSLAEYNFKKFIYSIKSYDQLKKDIELLPDNLDIEFKLPILDFNEQINLILVLLQNKQIMITKSTQIQQIKDKVYKKISADYTTNTWNEKSLLFLMENGISCITLHPELSYDDYLKFVSYQGIEFQIIYFGKIPIGYTRACFNEVGFCNSECCSNRSEFNNISKGYSLEVVCNNSFGYRYIFFVRNVLANAKIADNISKRVVLTDFSDYELNKFLTSIQNGKCFTKGDEIKIYGRSVK